MAETEKKTTTSGGSLNRELFERTLRYVSIVHIDGYELEEGWVRLAMWLTSASPGGFHDWKTLYQDRHRFYMWLHTYLDEAKLHYCSPTVPLLQIKNNADAIYKKQQ